jgi:hypothetical protein
MVWAGFLHSSGCSPVVSFCEEGDEDSDLINGGEFDD